ncbi:hypothetical protein TrRE_jg11602 [Triparma retinervis]|uniref:Mitochondrial-processing peptidase subunit alpha n=1 Tax=Triparma retinervis TaxID=2557542 RepID=A0A9W7C8U6_9STRA|nr:hypothetical protein TrRE_jg11602 [Triparma retinervis]
MKNDKDDGDKDSHKDSDKLQPPETEIKQPPITLSPLVSIASQASPTAAEVETTYISGLCVSSVEKAGGMTSVGICVGAGSKFETSGLDRGSNHAFELLCMKDTETMTSSDIISRLDGLGAGVAALSSRDQFMITCDSLRDNAEGACGIMVDCLLRGKFSDTDLDDCRQVMHWINSEMGGVEWVKEGMMGAAFGDTPLGNPHFCPLEDIAGINGDMMRGWRDRFLTRENMVVGGAGIEHARLVDMVGRMLEEVPNGEVPTCGESVYTGGEFRMVEPNNMDGLTRVAVGFEVGSWHDDDLVPTCVLQTLLGGGDSFSAGGPGKGMYSRLYREVLNRCYWAEAAEAYTIIHNDGGVIGIAGASVPNKSQDLTVVFLEQFAKLTVVPVSDEELSRAKNMIRGNILTQLESRQVLSEDIIRQMQTYGSREHPSVVCEKIDRVTKEDIMRIARRAMSKPPSISAVGPDLTYVPKFEQISHLRGASE